MKPRLLCRSFPLLALVVAACAAPQTPMLFGPRQTAEGVVFMLDMPAANRAQVVGSWEGNAWGGIAEEGGWLDPQRGRMQDEDGDGRWQRSVVLPPGRYAYRFVVDGHLWIDDPANPETATRGSLLVVQPSH